MSADGGDLAAALQTIVEIGDEVALAEAIDDAFPGASINVTVNEGYFELFMQQRGLLRPLRAGELSDGTLRYLLLTAALLSPRPAPLIVLNEPETSLHPDLLEPQGRLVTKAAEKTQVIVVSHARDLVGTLAALPGCIRYELRKELGETVADVKELPRWNWPKR